MSVLNAVQIIDGPYPFLKVDEQPIYMTCIWYVGIFILIYLVALFVFKLSLVKRKRQVFITP